MITPAIMGPDQFDVVALRWDGGWELHVAGHGVTQVRTLDQAVGQVRDFLATLFDQDDADYADADVEIIPEAIRGGG